MKVSIIIPVYNVENYIDKCLNSVVNQSYKNIEVIIVNDGSCDNSENIINKYLDKYSFIKYYKKENGGLSSARNYGLEKSNGDFVLFIDSDDYIEVDMVNILINKAINDDMDIVSCNLNFIYDNKIVKSNNYKYLTNDSTKLFLITPPMIPCKLYKRSLFDTLKFKLDIYYEDLELNPKMVYYTNKIGFVDDYLYNYVIRSNSIMRQSVFNDKLLNIFDVLDSNYKLLNDKYSMEIEYLYITHLLRSATLRFLDYDRYDLIDRIVDIFNERFVNYRNNIYYKKSGFKIKLICYLAYHKKYKLLKLIKKVGNIC